MATTPVIKAIIETRIEQLASFCEPQSNPYSVGFIIEKIPPPGADKAPKVTKAERILMAKIQESVLNCGTLANSWHGRTFEEWMRETSRDSLVLDASTTEYVQNRDRRNPMPVEFVPVDGATIRLADTRQFEPNPLDEFLRIPDRSKLINGHWPEYVQLYEGIPRVEFWPWELCYGRRNRTTDIRRGGYGVSELEDLMTTVTALLNATTYNANQFRTGAFPRGMLTWEGQNQPDPGKLAAWRREWQMMMSGADNAGRVPVLPAGFKYQDLEKNNRDMEYQEFLEFLIRLCCAAYKIDPSETCLAASDPGGGKSLFEGNNESRLKHSRDKGLVPLLRFKQAELNKFWVQRLNPGFRLRFVGIDALTQAEEVDLLTKRVGSINTLNEVRAEKSLPPLPYGNVPLNAVYLQAMGMAQNNQAVDDDQDPDDSAAARRGAGGKRDEDEPEPNDEDPFEKALKSTLHLSSKQR